MLTSIRFSFNIKFQYGASVWPQIKLFLLRKSYHIQNSLLDAYNQGELELYCGIVA